MIVTPQISCEFNNSGLELFVEIPGDIESFVFFFEFIYFTNNPYICARYLKLSNNGYLAGA